MPGDTGPFALATNKHPGPCWYCGKRVHKGKGALWREVRASGEWTVGHVECVAEGIQEGHGPQVAERSGAGRAGREAEMRARLEAGMPVPDAPPVPVALVLRRVREVMRTVRLDDSDAVLAAALAEIREAVGCGEASGEAVPF